MQIKSLGMKRVRMDDTTPGDAFERLRKIETYRELRAEGCGEAAALRAVGWSRSTYYRWQARYRSQGVKGLAAKSRRPRRTHPARWTRAQEWAVWRMRKHYPFMGKRRLKVMLDREGILLSESTIGRILVKGVCLRRITPCAFCRGRVTAKRRRNFANGHAQRWRPGVKAAQPGEWVQIDHMSVSRDGDTLKEFKAVCPVSKQLVVRVYSRATANNARRFLQAVRTELPCPLQSLQVDGGAEFRAEFEDACQTLQIPLAVLPPKSPQLNGVVERANDSSKTEFWNLYSGQLTVKDAAPALAQYQHFYNHVRPHYALDLLTPMQYLRKYRTAEHAQSHMS
ncbi:helix-turn-helix domain-containing protein [Candidatus Foliamicus sp.]